MSGIDCPRAKSDMTPCAARDGACACTAGGYCVGCGEHAADLLQDLVLKYIPIRARVEELEALHAKHLPCREAELAQARYERAERERDKAALAQSPQTGGDHE